MGLLSGGGNPAALKSLDRTNFFATNGQTTFTLTQGYSVGDVDVFLNGIKMVDGDDYYATNGTTVVLTAAASAGDHIQVISYNQFLASNTYTKSESDGRYMVASGINPMTSYLRTPNYGVSSYSDSASASLEASVAAGTNGVGIKAWGRSVSGSGGELTYVTDTRGASGNNIWYGFNGTSLSQFMRLDSSGRLTIPNQPAFHMTGTAGGTTYTTGFTCPFNTSIFNNGGHYNTSTYRFTAPVSGRYFFYASYLTYPNNDPGFVTMMFSVNGSTGYSNGFTRRQNSSQNDKNVSTILSLNAGDYVSAYVEPNGTISYYDSGGHGHFFGYLIG